MGGIGMLWLAASLTSAGELPDLDLQWRAPPQCPSSQAVERAIRARVAEDRIAGLEVSIEVSPVEDRRFLVELEVESPRGETQRDFDAVDCKTIVDAVALIVAIQADPIGFALREHSRSVAPAAARPAAPSVQRPAAVRPEPSSSPPIDANRPAPVVDATAPEERPTDEARDPVEGIGPIELIPETQRKPRPLDALVTAQGLAGWGRLPRVDLGVAGAIGVARPRVRVEIGAGYLARQRARVEGTDASAQLSLVTGRLNVCPVAWANRTVSLPLCIGLELGAMRGEGRGGARNERDWAAWAAGDVGPRVVWSPRGGPIGLWAQVDLSIPIARPQFSFEDTDPVHQSQPVGVLGGFGLEARFSVTERTGARQE